MEDLVYRDGVYYKKFSDEPFTGKITGTSQGLLKNGKEEGYWVIYHDNGQLWSKGKYKNGNREGYWEIYHQNGMLLTKGNYKNNKKQGVFHFYDNMGAFVEMMSGTFKDDHDIYWYKKFEKKP